MKEHEDRIGDVRGATVCILGRSFCGKGTQCEKLKAEFKRRGLPYSYTYLGSIFRRMKNEDSQRGRVIREHDNEGKFQPSWIANEVLQEGLGDVINDGVTIKVFDGSPRILIEAQFLDDQLKKTGRPPPICIYIDLSRQECVERFISSSDDRGREDDDVLRLCSRLDEFDAHTRAVLEYYRRADRLVAVDGRGSPDEVFGRIKARLFFP